VHHGRCYQSTLANALYNLSGHPVINYSKILISGNIPHFSEMQPSQNTPIKLEPLPYDLSRRNLGHDKLVKVLTEAGWDMVSQRGSHFNYQPKLDGFKGSFAITHHGGREKYQSAKQTQRYLRNLMKVNHDPEAQGVITHLQGCFIEALKL
ncbi:MAG TPA: type II toxin-antitoxin system HicA family toxin, partial [Alphaproteobacteria bacterium]